MPGVDSAERVGRDERCCEWHNLHCRFACCRERGAPIVCVLDEKAQRCHRDVDDERGGVADIRKRRPDLGSGIAQLRGAMQKPWEGRRGRRIGVRRSG
jgi:hypothetical protein